jgi:hypothetical protein
VESGAKRKQDRISIQLFIAFRRLVWNVAAMPKRQLNDSNYFSFKSFHKDNNERLRERHPSAAPGEACVSAAPPAALKTYVRKRPRSLARSQTLYKRQGWGARLGRFRVPDWESVTLTGCSAAEFAMKARISRRRVELPVFVRLLDVSVGIRVEGFSRLRT